MSLQIPTLQRYIFREMFRVFLFVLLCTTILLVFVGLFQQATERGLTAMHALQVIPFVVPHMLPFTIPASLLLTVSLVYGRLAGDQEVIAAKAAGIHPMTIMWPSLFLGATLSAGTLWMSDQLIPWSMTKIEQHALAVIEDVFLERLRTELQFSDRSTGLHVNVAGVQGRRLIYPVFRYAKGSRVVTMQAEEAEIHLDMVHQEVVVELQNGLIDLPGEDRVLFSGTEIQRIKWEPDDEKRKGRDLPILAIQSEIREIESYQSEQQQIRAIEAFMALNSADFERLIDQAKRRTKEMNGDEKRYNKLTTEVQSRYAMSCSCFFFVLLGTPIALWHGHSQFLKSFMICFVPIVCVYYPLMIGLMGQSKNGVLSPYWLWTANVLVVGLSLWTLKRVVRY